MQYKTIQTFLGRVSEVIKLSVSCMDPKVNDITPCENIYHFIESYKLLAGSFKREYIYIYIRHFADET
jgi:hypothetical protein